MNQFRTALDKSEKTDKDFLSLSNWVILFCLQDGIWGVLGTGSIRCNTLFFIFSTIFHAAAAVSAYIWLSYILNFINIERDKAIPAKMLSIALVLFQFILLLLNIKSRFIFDVDAEGLYIARQGRNLLYYSQYFTFFVIALFSAYRLANAKKINARRHYAASFLFILAPVLCGLLQKAYPLAPCDSIGYMLGCCTIYAFFISKISRNRDLSQRALIISGLSADYDLVLYVNTTKNQTKYYQVSNRFAPLLAENHTSPSPQNFDDLMRRIYVPNEFSGFIEKSTLEKCIEIVQTSPYYSIPFLANINGHTEHYRLKIASDKGNSNSFVVGIINVEMEHRLEETALKLRKDLQHTKLIANKDPLTGVGSAAAFKAKCELIDSEIKAKDKIKFAIIECDVNDLKVINDTFGHDMGDEYIKNCSKVFCDIFKRSPVYRIGGDEFAIILFNEQYEKRSELFEKLRAAVNRKPDAPKESISFAAGMADFSKQIDECVKDVLKRADTFMYIDKGKLKS
jgi:diguanylate cyclase (GGDEF)-like protein